MEPRKQYTKEFKLDAVSLVLDQGLTIAEAARSLGIRANILGRWIRENQADNNGQAFRGNGKLTLEQAEIRRLKIENKQLKLERQILKLNIFSSTSVCRILTTELHFKASATIFSTARFILSVSCFSPDVFLI